jgi:hypothetical protein
LRKLFAITASALIYAMPVRGAGDKVKSPPIAGTYIGVVEGDKAAAILKADGAMVVRPNIANRNFSLRGTWKREGNNIIAKLKNPDGEEGTAFLRLDKGDLLLLKVISPDGEVKQFSPPLFKRKKRLADKGLAGVYVGEFDGEQLQVEVKPAGDIVVLSAEDLNGDAIYTGKWKATDFGLRARIKTEDGEEANVEFVVTVRGLSIRKVINPNGEEETFGEARLKRQKHSGGKN